MRRKRLRLDRPQRQPRRRRIPPQHRQPDLPDTLTLMDEFMDVEKLRFRFNRDPSYQRRCWPTSC